MNLPLNVEKFHRKNLIPHIRKQVRNKNETCKPENIILKHLLLRKITNVTPGL